MLSHIALSLLLAMNNSIDIENTSIQSQESDVEQPSSQEESEILYVPPPIGFLPPSARNFSQRPRPVPLGNPGKWVIPDDYPTKALREELGGAVGFRLDIDEIGMPTKCTITQSSGYEILNTKTCMLLIERARFRPALDRIGKPIKGHYSNRVLWKIPYDDPPLSYEEMFNSGGFANITTIEIDDFGNIINCKDTLIGNHPTGSTRSLCKSPKISDAALSLIKSDLDGTKKFTLRFLTYDDSNIEINNIAKQQFIGQKIFLKGTATVTPTGKTVSCDISIQISSAGSICDDYKEEVAALNPIDIQDSRKFNMLFDIISHEN